LQWHTTRVRRLRRRIEFFQGTLDSTSEISEARIFDTTLRDGEQSPRTSFSYDDKREIAAVLDDMGTHVIEAGFPVNSEAEFEAVRDIADATATTVCGLARVVDEDIDAALESGVEMVHVFCSTSDVQLQDSMHASREEAVERSVAAVERVREAGATCMFSPMDATRTDEPYLIDVVEAVSAAGADWINVPDTCGVATPRRFGDLIEVVLANTDARVDVLEHVQDIEITDEQGTRYLHDDRIELAETSEEFRRIVFKDVDGEELAYLTTLSSGYAPVEVMSIYTLRTMIEILFRELKQYTNIEKFYSQSLNGVLFEIFCTLIGYVLVEWFRHATRRGWRCRKRSG